MMHLTVCVQLIFQVLCTRRDCLSGILRLASIGWQCSRATLESERGERPKRRGSAGGNFIKARDVMSAKLSKQKPIAEFDFVYDWDNFTSVSKKCPVNLSQAQLEKGKSVILSAEVVHKASGRTQRAKGDVVKSMKRPELKTKYKLLTGSVCPEEEEPSFGKKKNKKIGRGIPQMQVRLVYDNTLYPASIVRDQYIPRLFVDEFWMTDDQLVKLNKSGSNLFDTEVTFGLMSAPRWRFQTHMEHSFTMNAKMFGEDSEEMLQIRDLFANTSPMLLVTTMIVSVLHMIFEFLAFKNDVIFWQGCSPEMLNKFVSVQSILVGIFMQILLLFYLWDESANIIVLATNVVSILIDCWKVQRAMKFAWIRVCGVPLPWLASKVTRKKEDDFDSQAMKWLGILLSPGIVGYGVYTLLVDCHRGWYSLFLHFTASCVYSLGFVLMTPQVFINYKHKTVAFLPWRKFVYRAINTFIDDLFAFIIRMPTMHRLSCFRDDIVFVIYLYQRWYYPVDKSRTFDEDGYELDGEDESANEPSEDKKTQ
mmetsp:Transcript_89804/g.164565  ORF Transcript_89804/g.164565 Transcript_89804/m.164565 type:complete len:535 (-) Transcript_89804:50-1654(-)